MEHTSKHVTNATDSTSKNVGKMWANTCKALYVRQDEEIDTLQDVSDIFRETKKSHQVILITSLQTCKPQCKRESERTAEHEENILDIKRKELEQITMSLVVAHG